MKLYTRTGDEGKTSIIGGRLDKDHIRVEAYGTVDEINSHIGHTLCELDQKQFEDIYYELQKIQHELFDCGGDLATKSNKIPFKLKEEYISFLESRIDAYIEEAPKIEKFILPGGTKAAAIMHISRTVTRRAERHVVQLQKCEEVNPVVLKYLNRLSDYFFAAARVINARQCVNDIEYERSALVFREKDES